MNDLERMKELIQILNEAGKAYYQQDKEVMSNLEYDKMYDELLELRKRQTLYYPTVQRSMSDMN